MEMKKWMALALAGTMCFSMLTACGGDEEEYVEDDEIVEEDVIEDEENVEDDAEVEDDGEDVAPAYVEIPAVVINGTGVDIAALYISGASLDTWGQNLIPEGMVLPHGYYKELTLLVDENNLQWDIRIEDQEGVGITFPGLDITQMPMQGFGIELLFDGETATAAALADPSQMEGDYMSADEAPAEGAGSEDVAGGEPVIDESWAMLQTEVENMVKMMNYFEAAGAPEECVEYLNAGSALLAEMGEGNREDFTEEAAMYYIDQLHQIGEFLIQYVEG